ncbi:pectinesterase-like [Salvia miltiorrhiza]|uniref:pectinesterase-like n=1 Tax=Salvia miltiorrhiza TaxID=226208 RepID=UPI0025ABE4E1|nr:pectinesterase-like [Salvia miltiorrhiza]
MAHFRHNKAATAAASLAAVLIAACIASAAAAPAAGDQKAPSKEIVTFCGNTGFKDTCLRSLAGANSTQPKDLIKAAFESAVAEIEVAIKNTTLYKSAEADRMTKGALDVCERVLARSIDEVRRSFDSIQSFDVGKIDHALDDVKVWLSGAITNKETCIDAFAKTRSKTGQKIKDMLKTSGELLSNGLAMVIEFQKVFQSVSKNLGSLADRLKQRQLLSTFDSGGGMPAFVTGQARKLLQSPTMSLPPNATVAQDGSGQFKSIQEAVNTVPLKGKDPFVILVKAGVYKEYVTIPKGANHIIMIGEGPLKTRITGDKCFKNGFQTYDSSTLSVNGESFMAKDIGVENTAGAIGHQAVAVRASGDLGIFYNVHMDSYQDTLYAHTHRQLYRECQISGTVDFIFGNAISVFQKCNLVVRKPNPNQACMVTAQGRTEKNLTGVTIIQGCTFTAEKELLAANPPVKSYLGRPWKELSRTIIMQSNIEGFIDPEGWAPWMGTFALDTLYYVEYNNTGPGADTSKRVQWKGLQKFANIEEAQNYTAAVRFKWDDWITKAGVPYDGGFMKI